MIRVIEKSVMGVVALLEKRVPSSWTSTSFGAQCFINNISSGVSVCFGSLRLLYVFFRNKNNIHVLSLFTTVCSHIVFLFVCLGQVPNHRHFFCLLNALLRDLRALIFANGSCIYCFCT